MHTTLELVDQYVDWTQWKMALNLSEKTFLPRKKEIWWASVGQNIGVEVNGKNRKFERPVLVINVFNDKSLFVVSLTSRVGDNQYMFSFTDDKDITSTANISQLRTISSKRLLRKVSEVTEVDFKKIISLIQILVLKAETPSSGVSSALPQRMGRE